MFALFRHWPATLFGALLVFSTPAPLSAAPPNVLVILTDDMRWDAMSCAGHPFLRFNYEPQFPYTPNVRAVRTPDWKFIRYPRGDGSPDRFTAEMYHLAGDPSEMKNLANDPKWARQRRALERELEKQSKAAGPDSMPVYGGIVNVLPKF